MVGIAASYTWEERIVLKVILPNLTVLSLRIFGIAFSFLYLIRTLRTDFGVILADIYSL